VRRMHEYELGEVKGAQGLSSAGMQGRASDEDWIMRFLCGTRYERCLNCDGSVGAHRGAV
jgi:hypothetical protein